MDFFVGNFKSSGGEYNVKEGFFETVVPLVSGVTLAESLDFNGAVRVVDYSRSGTVTPWKAGLTYDVTDELRFRAIRSRDIRAPNLNDLFQTGSGGSALIVDPLTGTQVQVPVQRIGNPELEPEAANTTSFGIVLRPEWLPGFSASIDYFKIRLRGAIGNLSGQQVVDQCVAGEANLCSFVVRNPGGAITQVLSPGLNIDEERTSGVDLDLRYGLPVHLGALEGKLNLGAIGTYTHERVVETSVQSLDYAGQLGDAEFATPQWRWHFIANYVQGDTSATLQGRYIGSGQLNNAWSAADIVDNSVASVFYLDLAGARTVRLGDSKAQLFVAIDNVFDRAAPVSPVISGQQHLNYGANSYVYDLIGRSYRAGVRFEF